MSYAKGAARERKVAELLTYYGFVVYRSAGSHGCADLVALRDGAWPLLVQVKRTIREFGGFGPDDRWDLLKEAECAGALAVFCWHPPNKLPSFRIGPKWQHEVDIADRGLVARL
jgi:Holliday junction resolvase